MLNNDNLFRTYWKNEFSSCSTKMLIEYESVLSEFIDNDYFGSSVLIDEVLIMYELVRNECVHRVSMMA